ncbi:MAG: AsnC family transcriptional regulator [Cyclobacteriaceae bacterium]|nr:MAG: AsnC family transcriptional regulator [Cyclobacteriaceae bacterium]
MSQKLDATDRKILRILQSNAKITNAQLSQEVGLSPAPTLERVKKLEKTGVIKSYHAALDEHCIGLEVSTYLLITLKGHNKSNMLQFTEAIDQIDEVIECYHITGRGDFLLKTVSTGISAYQSLILEQISEIPVVDNLESMVILSTLKKSSYLPLPQD